MFYYGDNMQYSFDITTHSQYSSCSELSFSVSTDLIKTYTDKTTRRRKHDLKATMTNGKD